MTSHKLTPGELLAGVAGVVLVASLFAPWYDGRSAFRASGVMAAFLVLCAAGALVLAASTAWQRSQAIPVAAEAFAILLAAGMLVVVAVRDLVHDDTRWGAWVGLAAVAGILSGCWRALRTPERR